MKAEVIIILSFVYLVIFVFFFWKGEKGFQREVIFLLLFISGIFLLLEFCKIYSDFKLSLGLFLLLFFFSTPVALVCSFFSVYFFSLASNFLKSKGKT
jgi:hypothetical protein